MYRYLSTPPRPEDVANFLYNPELEEPSLNGHQQSRVLLAVSRNCALFPDMIKAIMSQKENPERT
ncbi:Uncharacterized protein FWK35_00018133 [Aphis craccivora]|uniref:Uncharacterized protein n=1 Tax=Aphis craccivora TaxID=307492 RepID=A0A6G0YUN5_APHCR|nr:Uncharacterized protein FWK35_00018133 [Aphis craccivora]